MTLREITARTTAVVMVVGWVLLGVGLGGLILTVLL